MFRGQDVALLRHARQFVMRPRRDLDDQTLQALPWHQQRTVIAPFQSLRLEVETESGFLFFGAVTLETTIGEKRLDVPRKIHGARRGGREP